MRNSAGDKERLLALMVTSEREWRGGERQLLLLMRGMRELGHDVELAAPEGSEIALRAGRHGMKCHVLNVTGGMDVTSAWRLRSLMRAKDYDVVHAHSSHAHSVLYLATAGASESPPRVVSRRVDFAASRNPLSGRKYRHGAELYLAISRASRKTLRQGGVPEQRIRLVPSGIELDKFDQVRENAYLRKEFNVPAEAVVIGTVGALTRNKAQVDLVTALPAVRDALGDVRAFIVGEGKARREIEAQIDQLNLGDIVTLTGFRPDIPEFLSLFDCFVMPSRHEGLCTSIMDAQAMGVPVAASETGGIVDLVTHEETGLLFISGVPDEIASAIIRILSDDDLRQRCIRAAKEKSSGYDYRQMVYKTIDAYHELRANN